MNELDMSRDELVAEARLAIEAAKRKKQRWLIWQLILDDWEAGFGADGRCTPEQEEEQ